MSTIVQREGREYLILRMWTSVEDYDGASCCVVPLSDDAIRQWQARRAQYATLQTQDADLSGVEFTDDTPEWRQHDEETEPLAGPEELYHGGIWTRCVPTSIGSTSTPPGLSGSVSTSTPTPG